MWSPGAFQKGLLFAYLFSCATTLQAQGTNIVEGYVRANDYKPMANVTVLLKGPTGLEIIDRTNTDREGHYMFSIFGVGSYMLVVDLPYAKESKSAIVTFSRDGGINTTVDFVITVPSTREPPASASEPVFTQNVPAEAERAYQSAMEKLRAGEKKAAIAALEHAVEIFPVYLLALNQLGIECMQAGNAQDADRWFARAAAVNPNSAIAHFGLGWVYYQNQELSKAAEELRQAVKLNSQASETYWFLGLTTLELRLWTEAETAFLAFLRLRPQNDRPLAHLYLTSVYSELGRYDAAVSALETYLKIVPEKQRTQKLRNLLEQLKRKRDQR